MKPVRSIAAAAIAISAMSAQAPAQEAEARAVKEYELNLAVASASRAWREAFNAGDAAAAAAMYEEDAVMVAKPFGRFEGREAIQGFWKNIIEQGFDDVIYFNTTTTVVDKTLTAARVSADWEMNNARGIITNELWVLQPDGTARLREDHFEVAE